MPPEQNKNATPGSQSTPIYDSDGYDFPTPPPAYQPVSPARKGLFGSMLKERGRKRTIMAVTLLLALVFSGTIFALKTAGKNPVKTTGEVPQVQKKPETDTTKASKTTKKAKNSDPIKKSPSATIDKPPVDPDENTPAINVKKGFDYYYAGAYQYATASGASVTLSQEMPKVMNSASSHNHSVAELSIESVDGKQIVEVGWVVDPIMNGDSKPHLFVYHWIDGEGTCYNECGFVQVSSSHFPGDPLTTGVTGIYKINYSGGEWQIYYNGDELGYFPASLWSGEFTTARFIQVFGEIAKNSTGVCLQMGNGIRGSKPGSAQISDFTLINSVSIASLVPYATSPYDYGNATGSGLSYGGSDSC
ncbi:MAG TPA: neprosin family prolyl endopeptidase [Candidatus Saccharimonadales bacterium]|nr:neprosin family prolyl endopeptidase [Candidatus Saccharimonadales bacterium]